MGLHQLAVPQYGKLGFHLVLWQLEILYDLFPGHLAPALDELVNRLLQCAQALRSLDPKGLADTCGCTDCPGVAGFDLVNCLQIAIFAERLASMNICLVLRHSLVASRTPHGDPPKPFKFERHRFSAVPAVFSYRICAPHTSALQGCRLVLAFRRLPNLRRLCSTIERRPPSSSGERR